MIMELTVSKRSEDVEKGNYVVVLKGKSHDILSNCLVDVQLKISGKYEDLIETFPLNQPIFFKLNPKQEE